jgi:glutaredoxin
VTGVETIIVFTADGCPHSAALCADLCRRGVRFVEINLSHERHRIEELRRHCWEHRLPVVLDHERVSIGFRGASSTFQDVGLDDL